ncbi:periplasmic nitrate reductase, NapE protein [Marivita sp.]|uniref:periplasmic nitrate reductase, NapE protein n=1 Tax=Marivita sp. TaxID=2003365 RepID=UPI0025B914BC|nr:periplasmic nitrate reductase, NapE protein [Marivita sp.]
MAPANAPAHGEAPQPKPPEKRHETIAFVFLSVVLFPLLSIILVGGFGFIIWMQHLLLGPPGSP